MTKEEYLEKKVIHLENVVNALINSIANSFPHIQGEMYNLTTAWNNADDNLKAEYGDLNDE